MDNLASHFPIKSQTSEFDKLTLLRAINFMKKTRINFRYLEIGSFLGGSLVPFLQEPNCVSVVSVDDRGRQQYDERGAYFDYSEVTSEQMLKNLTDYRLNVSKLIVHNGSIEDFGPKNTKYDMVFIDGEHTDVACFRDFIYVLPFMERNSLLLFHDSSYIFKSIEIALTFLKARRFNFEFKKIKKSNISVFLIDPTHTSSLEDLGETENWTSFVEESEMRLLEYLVQNRYNHDSKSIEPRPTIPAMNKGQASSN